MRIWITSPNHTGTRNQGLGVAEALLDGRADRIGSRITVAHAWMRYLLAIPFVDRFFAPDLVISCSQAGERRARRLLAGLRGPRRFLVQIERPAGDGPRPDLTFISHHDWRAEDDSDPTVRRMHGVPHRMSDSRLAKARSDARAGLVSPSGKVVSVFVGGPNEAFDYDDEVAGRLSDLIRNCVRDGNKVLVSTSRRTPPVVSDALRTLRSPSVSVWLGEKPNPYLNWLAAADAIVVSEDSITMTCEAVASGRPVYNFRLARKPGARLDKFMRFHDHLRDDLGATRSLDGGMLPFAPHPFDDTTAVARQIDDAMAARGI